MLDIIYQDQAIVVCVKPFRPWASPTPRSGRSTGWTRWWAA